MFDTFKFPKSSSVAVQAPDPYARVVEVAARLGVDPLAKDESAPLTFVGGGQRYDFFALVAAFLDRMDACLDKAEK